MNVGGKNFFSPHPVENLDTKTKLLDFLQRQVITFGVLRRHDWEELERTAIDHGMHAQLLKVVGDEYVVKVVDKKVRGEQ